MPQFFPGDEDGGISEPLGRLQTFSIGNNQLMEFPTHLFVKRQNERRQIETIQVIQINDNKIANLPSQIGLIKVKSLIMHSNPISQLPLSLINTWDSVQEVSLDWFSYLLPVVGRKIVRESKQQQNKDTSMDLDVSNADSTFLNFGRRDSINSGKGRKANNENSMTFSKRNQSFMSKGSNKTLDKFKKML